MNAIIVSLDYYRDKSIPWRELAKDRIQISGGEAAYMVRLSRERVDMTQVELAKKLGMPQANISQIETGRRSVGKALAKKFAKIFNRDFAFRGLKKVEQST
ncbi:helix-turn-helix transcriptional regulator [Candidatus Nomurabacteria bacterium]|nr:helix-turn-helix transcriptional regulator [Candidatus Nomurabacteria bacterium]